jgi:hypothetical protein
MCGTRRVEAKECDDIGLHDRIGRRRQNFLLVVPTMMYGSSSGANPLLMQAFRDSGSGSSPAFSHTHSFLTSSDHTAAHSTLSSPGLGYASFNDDDMLSLSSPIPTSFPDLYPVPAVRICFALIQALAYLYFPRPKALNRRRSSSRV